MQAFKKCLKNARMARFAQIIVLGDFDLPEMDWTTYSSKKNDRLYEKLQLFW